MDPYEYSNVRISPSGKYLSLIQTEGEINTLVVLDMASMKPLTSVKYGEKGKTKKLNVCCTRWINDELLSYGATRKLGTLEGEGRTPYMFFLRLTALEMIKYGPLTEIMKTTRRSGESFSKALLA